jgi:acyl-coenzyme A synthetase/AMP-(fatty) acid ligase
MKIITSQILKDDFELKILERGGIVKEVNRDFIIDAVGHVKTYLINTHNVRPGQKVVLATTMWPDYLIIFLAVAELGLSFVVTDYPKLGNSFSVHKKLSLYGSIDHVIGHPLHGDDIWNHFPESNCIKLDLLDCFTSTQEHKDTIWANEESILIYSTSSGSTGTPKVITHNHRFFSELLHRNAKIYGLNKDDRCLHNKGLHHGSVTGVFFLPTLQYCSYHYYTDLFNNTCPPAEWVDWIQKEKMTRVFLMTKSLDEFCEHLDIDNCQHNDLNLYVLSYVGKEHIKNCYKIWSIFGCTETSGPLFLPCIDQTIDPEKFDRGMMGSVLDDFYKLSLDNDILQVTMPTGEIISTGDKFEVRNEIWHHLGRDTLYRLKNGTIFFDVLVECIESYTKTHHQDFFDVVIDKEEDSIYIRTNEALDLDSLNRFIETEILTNSESQKNYVVHKQLVGKREDFITGIKFDPEEVRLRCRKL